MTLSLLARATAVLLTCPLATAVQADALAKADIEAALDAAYSKYKTLQEGANADYIPALAKVDSNIYGIAPVTPDCALAVAGPGNPRAQTSCMPM